MKYITTFNAFNSVNENNSETREKVNLIDKYKDSDIEEEFDKFKSKVKGFTDENTKHNLKTGDTITFVGGYNDDLEFTSKILGFDSDGHAFVLWDCYWFPVNLDTRQLIK